MFLPEHEVRLEELHARVQEEIGGWGVRRGTPHTAKNKPSYESVDRVSGHQEIHTSKTTPMKRVKIRD